jgi:hypothetical protein
MIMALEDLFKKKVEPVDKLDEVKPLTLNLCLSKVDGVIQAELRKRFAITDSNKAFWIDFFEKSLSDIPIKVESQIVFRDKLASKQKFKEFGLLNPSESVFAKEVKKENKILDSFVKEVNSDSMQEMAKNSKRWLDEEFLK